MTFGGGLRELRLAVVDDQPLYRQMLASDVRYRFVIDIATLTK